ncbi:hypothetical protein ABV409_12365 [Flagellimonas sp. DF-77]|uniref:hypothetical protein n=1 Tax=Flagellimonas algarum TaxID=3230298 RepID=UPI0033987468
MLRTLKFAVLLSLVAFVQFACSSDDGGGQEEVNQGAALAGNWALAEVNVSEPIDVNDDQNTSSNLLTEVPCLTGTLTLTPDFTYQLSEVLPQLISPITNDLYNVSCSDVFTRSGSWSFSGTTLTLSGTTTIRFQLEGDDLVITVGEVLPGIDSIVYRRQ